MAFTMDIATREARIKNQVDAAFARWLDDPLVRMAMASVPAGDNADAFRLLLRSAFDAGSSAGQGTIAGEILAGMLDRRAKEL